VRLRHDSISEDRSEIISSSHSLENLTSGCPDLTPQVIQEIADAFREIFSNEWPEFAACFSCDARLPQRVKFSASEILRPAATYIPLSQLENVKALPPCPHCGRQMEFFIDSATTVQKLALKFSRNAFITLIRSDRTREISGFTFASLCSLKQAFEQEEWKHPYAYAAQQDPRYERSFTDFLEILAPELERISGQPVDSNTEVFLSNCVAIKPCLRSRGFLAQMLTSFYLMIPEELHNVPVLGQAEKGSKFYQLLQKAGLKKIEGFLPRGQAFMCGHHGSFSRQIVARIARRQ
jgi:hypothetical protein